MPFQENIQKNKIMVTGIGNQWSADLIKDVQ